MASDLQVNDYVKIDGRESGRIVSIVRPLGTYKVCNIRTYEGEMRQVPWYRLAKMPRTVRSNNATEGNDDVDIFDPEDEVSDEQLMQMYDRAEIDKFIDDNQNRNTMRKTTYNVKRLVTYMSAKGDHRAIETIEPPELCDILCTFFIELKKDDGSNYEPSTVRGMLSSFDRYLKSKRYSASLINDKLFDKLTSVMKTKQKVLKSEGMGNLPKRAESLSDDDILKLFESKQLGTDNPESLLNTMWWNNTTHFGLRSVKPHVDMRWGDVSLKRDGQGSEYLEFIERQTKTCQGDNPAAIRKIHPKAWATNDTRCPVAAYKLYSRLRPSDYSLPDSPFYIATNTKEPSDTYPWFKRQPVGVNKLSTIMKRMSRNAGFSDKNFTNHSARKYLVQKLSDENIPPTQIMQISGHRNIQSVNNYSQISSSQHRNISNIVSGHRAIQPAVKQSSLPSSTVGNVDFALSSSSTSSSVNQSGTTLLSSLFAAPIHGGTFNINFYSCSNPTCAKRSKVDD